MINTKEQARTMYMSGKYSQRDIAKELCISERTVYNWIQNNTWDKLRQAAFAAPAIIANNLCNQLVELQNAIAAREPGQRFPTMQEAVITGKLIAGIEKMKKYPSLPQNMQVLETFKQYVSPKVDRKFNSQMDFCRQKQRMGTSHISLSISQTALQPSILSWQIMSRSRKMSEPLK